MPSPSTSMTMTSTTTTAGTSSLSSSPSSSTLGGGFVGTPFATDPRFDYPFPPTTTAGNDAHPRSSPPTASAIHAAASSSPPHTHVHPSAASPRTLRALAENPPIPPRLLALDLDDVLLGGRLRAMPAKS